VLEIDPRDSAMIRRAAELVRRECPSHAATGRDDMIQEGWLALLEAQARGRLPPDPGPHRYAYITQRTMGAMRDARRKAFRALPDDVSQLPSPDTEVGAGDSAEDDMLDRAHVLGQARRILGHPRATPVMRDTLRALISGETLAEIAQRRGCSVSAAYKVGERLDWLGAMLR